MLEDRGERLARIALGDDPGATRDEIVETYGIGTFLAIESMVHRGAVRIDTTKKPYRYYLTGDE